MTRAWRTVLLMLAALAGMILAATGLLDQGLGRIGLDDLGRANQRYLEASYDRALDGFLVLSAVKSGLAVIEGSEVGIGFSLEVGDLVQSVYDYVNIAWKTVLAGGTILLMTRLALDGVTLADHYVLAAAFGAWLLLAAVQGLSPRRHGLNRMMRSIAAACTFVAVLLYLALPLAVFGASQLSQRITRPLIASSYDTFREVRRTFSTEGLVTAADSPTAGQSAVQATVGLGERYERLKKRLGEMEVYLGEQAHRLAGTTFQLIAGYLFDCVIFPLAFVVILILLVREIPTYVAGARWEPSSALPRR